MNPEGEYKRFVHLFSFVEHNRPDNPGIHMGEHYCYPWPAPCEPTLAYIEAVYHMDKFVHWPTAWVSFWAELAVCTDLSQLSPAPSDGQRGPVMSWHHKSWKRFGERGDVYAPATPEKIVTHGPYMVVLARFGESVVADAVVAIKREMRRKYPASYANDPEAKLHNEITAKVLSHYAPHLLREAVEFVPNI